eukprot:gene9039-8164_t
MSVPTYVPTHVPTFVPTQTPGGLGDGDFVWQPTPPTLSEGSNTLPTTVSGSSLPGWKIP